MRSVLNILQIFNVQSTSIGKTISMLLRRGLLRKLKKPQGAKSEKDYVDAIFMKGAINMSKIDEYIAKRSQRSANFTREYKEENQQLQVAVEVHSLRDKLGMSQREFAKLVGKPQSTIARIESGKMNVSINVLNEIADATNQKLTVRFEPITA